MKKDKWMYLWKAILTVIAVTVFVVAYNISGSYGTSMNITYEFAVGLFVVSELIYIIKGTSSLAYKIVFTSVFVAAFTYFFIYHHISTTKSFSDIVFFVGVAGFVLSGDKIKVNIISAIVHFFATWGLLVLALRMMQ